MKAILNGLHSEIPAQDYFSIDAVSSTLLRELNKSPAHARSYLDLKKEPTQAMKFGTGFHALIGEPELFAKKYVKAPEGIDRRTKDGKTAYAEFLTLNPGKEILTSEEYQQLDGMLYSILKNRTALSLLTGGKAEQSVFWEDRASGVKCKCRPDYLRNDGIVVDLKTSEDGSKKGFRRSLVTYSYHIQSAFYLDGVSQVVGEPLTDFVHVVVEKRAPYAVSIYSLDDASLDMARQEIARLLKLYAECEQSGTWPSYPEEIQNVTLPFWMMEVSDE